MKKLLIIFLFIFSSNLFATETCKTLDSSTWTQNERNQRQAIFYALAFDAGQDVVPRINGDQICFESPIFNVNNLVTRTNFKTRLDTEDAAREAARQAIQAKEDERKALKAQITADYQNFDTMTGAQKLDVLKKMVRIRSLEEDRT